MPNPAAPAPPLHRLIGSVFRAFVSAVRILPDWLAYGVADALVPVLVVVTFASRRKASRKRRGFYHNLRIVYRDRLSTTARRRLLWRWARHMTHFGVDVCKMAEITGENMHDYCDLTEMPRLRRLYDQGAGVIGVTGHTGVYEYSGHLVALAGMATVTIFRPSPIRPVTDAINDLRRAGGQTMTERTGGVRQILRALRDAAVTGILADVSSKHSEIFVPFLGTLAATNNTVGVLHLKTGAPIVVLTTQRTARRRFKFHVWEVIEHAGTGDRTADLHAIAQRFNDALSLAIRSYPEQWFWDSRRFRNRPKDEPLGDDGLPRQTEPAQAGSPPNR